MGLSCSRDSRVFQQCVPDMHRRTGDVRGRLCRINHIMHESTQLTSGPDNVRMQQEQYRTVATTTAAAAASFQLESTPDRLGVVCGPIQLSQVFDLSAVISLYSALYSRVHTSTISEIPPAPMLGETMHVRGDQDKKHKTLKTVQRLGR